jgi:hypothetical protein
MKAIHASWLRSYEWCPIQVMMAYHGIPTLSVEADLGNQKHKTIEDTVNKYVEFEEIPKEELLEKLKTETIVAKPDSLSFKGFYEDYIIFGRPDMVFSENGEVTLVDFKTTKKLEVRKDVILQMCCYLFLSQKEGLENVKGMLCLTPEKKDKIKQILVEKLEEGEIPLHSIKSFIQDENLFPVRKIFSLDPKLEFSLYKQMDKIILSIERDEWKKPEDWKCKVCSTENCPVKNKDKWNSW